MSLLTSSIPPPQLPTTSILLNLPYWHITKTSHKYKCRECILEDVRVDARRDMERNEDELHVPRMHAKRIMDRDTEIEDVPHLEIRIQREVGTTNLHSKKNDNDENDGVAVSDITRNVGITMSGRLRRERHQKMEMIVPSRVMLVEGGSKDAGAVGAVGKQTASAAGKQTTSITTTTSAPTTTSTSTPPPPPDPTTLPPPPNLYSTYTYTLTFKISKDAMSLTNPTDASQRKRPSYAILAQAVSIDDADDVLFGANDTPFLRVQGSSDTNIVPLKLQDDETRDYYTCTTKFTLHKSETERPFRISMHVFDASTEKKIERFVDSANEGDGSSAAILSLVSVELKLAIKKKRKSQSRKRKRTEEIKDDVELRKRISEIINIKDYKKLLKKLTNVRDNLSAEQRYHAEELTIDRLNLERLDKADVRYLAKMSQYSTENRLDHHFGNDLPFSIHKDGFEEVDQFFDECEEKEEENGKRRRREGGGN